MWLLVKYGGNQEPVSDQESIKNQESINDQENSPIAMMAMTSIKRTTSETIVNDGIMAIKLMLQSQTFLTTIVTSWPTTMTITRMILRILVTDGAKPSNHPANYMISKMNPFLQTLT